MQIYIYAYIYRLSYLYHFEYALLPVMYVSYVSYLATQLKNEAHNDPLIIH